MNPRNMTEVVEFDIIEAQKENIEPRKEGRSAAALKTVLGMSQSQLRQQNSEQRSLYETSIADLDEVDDPIQPFIDYLDWIQKSFPSGNTTESGLVELLERCISHFQKETHWNNDPRYLKVWMTYAKYAVNPRDIFVFMARNEIGKQLATYYEEFANYYEGIGKIAQAREVYEEGLKQLARPFPRLQRRYREFMKRCELSNCSPSEPVSPAFPVRSALMVKSGPLFAVHDDSRSIERRRLDIFNDPVGSPGLRTSGWNSLNSGAMRDKENRFEATPWIGEKLLQEKTTSAKPKPSRVPVFKDSSDLPATPVFSIIPHKDKKPERLDINLDLLNNDGEEFCLYEVLATMRRLCRRDTPKIELTENNVHPDSAQISLVNEIRNEFTETIRLSSGDLKRPASPTATLFTKQAKDEVYSMFNQSKGGKKPEDDVDQFIYDEFTEQFTQTGINDLTESMEQKKKRKNEDGETESFIQKTCIVAPADEQLKEMLLGDLNPSLNTYKGCYRYEKSMNMSMTLKKSLNLKQSKHVFIEFEGTMDPYNLKSLLGEGGFACVYLAESMTGDLKAIKCQKPSSAWEFYILSEIHKRLKGDVILRSIVVPDEIHFYKDESYLILDYIEKGTILDVVNVYRSAGRPVDEILVVFITVELLKVIEALHSVGIMHGDLKADNCMLRLRGSYDGSELKSWKQRGIKLIDFGRSIDMTLFPKNVTFRCNWKTDAQDCPEMRNKETWTYQADYFGIAGIIHTMLYGCFIETKFDGEKHRLVNPIKRYWQQDLWNPLFDFLMNSRTYGTLPQTEVFTTHRKKLEAWLETNDLSLVSILKDVKTGLK